MEIGRPEGVPGPGRIERPKVPRTIPPSAPSPSPVGKTDSVEISEIGHFISQASQLPQIRSEKVEAIRKEIEQGRFETPQKLSDAIERFLEENPDLF
jgi:negative regulator of flagellin synthesis FlgM